MSKQREAFEAWLNQHLTMDGYHNRTIWDAWQASRAAALDEAIEKCHEVSMLGTVFVGGKLAADACVSRVSALKEQS